MMESDIDLILETYDKDDADIVKKLIPHFFSDSWGEFMRAFHPFLGNNTKHPDFQFILADRISFLLEENDFNIDIGYIVEEVEKYYGTL